MLDSVTVTAPSSVPDGLPAKGRFRHNAGLLLHPAALGSGISRAPWAARTAGPRPPRQRPSPARTAPRPSVASSHASCRALSKRRARHALGLGTYERYSIIGLLRST